MFMEVSIAEKLEIFHMLQFEDGLKALVTMSGRAPLCMWCGEIGLVRQTCPPLRSTPGAGAARGTEAPAQRPADAMVPAPRQVGALDAPVIATPEAEAPVDVLVETAPTEGTPSMDVTVLEEKTPDENMEWVEVRGRRMSRSRSGGGDRIKRTCGSGEDITPLPKKQVRCRRVAYDGPLRALIIFEGFFIIDIDFDNKCFRLVNMHAPVVSHERAIFYLIWLNTVLLLVNLNLVGDFNFIDNSKFNKKW